jgi:8-oxo-dGTP pyrophosphatase MutT (NUDIX family)
VVIVLPRPGGVCRSARLSSNVRPHIQTSAYTVSVRKAVPIVVRTVGTKQEVLVFQHPIAGVQFVKGTVERDESVLEAAVRELQEESGLSGVSHVTSLGDWVPGFEGQTWHLELFAADRQVPDTWQFNTSDDGGRLFRFFWHPLQAPPGANWHAVYQSAMVEVRRRVMASKTVHSPGTAQSAV